MADATVEVKKYITDALFQEPLIYWDGRHAVFVCTFIWWQNIPVQQVCRVNGFFPPT